MAVKKKPGSGRLRKISIAELHLRVKAVPFHFRKNIRTLSFKIGIPRSTIQQAMKSRLLKSTKEDRIQLDNAPPHPKPGNLKRRIADRLAEYSAEGWDIGFALQPANSPDLNTLDLVFFRAIQSLQYQKLAKNLDEMIEIVHEAYADLPLNVCKNLWTTAQLVMNQVLLCNGGNAYKLPHIGKLKIAAANSSATVPCADRRRSSQCGRHHSGHDRLK